MAEAPAAPSWAVKMLGEQLLTQSDPSKPTGTLRPTDQVLAGKKFVLLYFSASWCPPCKKFTPFFSIVYEDLIEGADKNEVEVRACCRQKSGACRCNCPWSAVEGSQLPLTPFGPLPLCLLPPAGCASVAGQHHL